MSAVLSGYEKSANSPKNVMELAQVSMLLTKSA